MKYISSHMITFRRRFLVFLFTFLIPCLLVAGKSHVPHSVLASGTWYKIGVTQTGIYKITYNDLVKMGFSPESIDPDKIRIFGNGAGMLPESNATKRTDDLKENSIFVAGSSDGKFNTQDYILFYGEAADAWVYDSIKKIFNHVKNLYSDTTYYYINTDLALGKRVVPFVSLDTTPNSYSRHFADYLYHDIDSVNLAKTGKLWLGEAFSETRKSMDLSFSIPDIDTTSMILVATDVVAKSTLISSFSLREKTHGLVDSILVDSSPPTNIYLYGQEKLSKCYMFHPRAELNFTLKYNLPNSSSFGWLNYIELNYQRNLDWTGPQMKFCDPNA
ncbi:MAG: hypothetical protein Q8867_09665, partial [Bacteroidota bacterium]|nr:hypothetical protein [Bacteroidota bacterium]